MAQPESKGQWRGRPLEEFTKEELITIILEMARIQDEARAQHRVDIQLLGLGRP